MSVVLKWSTPGSRLILTVAAIALSGETAAAQGKANVTDVKFRSMPVAAVAQDLMVTSQGQCGPIKIDFGDASTFNIPSTVGRPSPGGSFVYATQHTYTKSGAVTVTATGTSPCAGKASAVVAIGAAPPPVPGSRSATPAEDVTRTLPREQPGKITSQRTTATPPSQVSAIPQFPLVVPALSVSSVQYPVTPIGCTWGGCQPIDIIGRLTGSTVTLRDHSTAGVPGLLTLRYRMFGIPAGVIDNQSIDFEIFVHGKIFYPFASYFVTTEGTDIVRVDIIDFDFPSFPTGSEMRVELSFPGSRCPVGVAFCGYKAEPVEVKWIE
jgi:hypothetical protein